jgi:RNA-dependent RNA polymerase
MQATVVEGLESYVGHGESAIFFPCVGSRSVADEIAGDGYMYWISKNPQVIHLSDRIFTKLLLIYICCLVFA